MNHNPITEQRGARPLTRKIVRTGLLAVTFTIVGIVVARALWRSPSPQKTPGAESTAGPIVPAETLWTCAMHPQFRQSKPGKCLICGMDLIQVTKTGGGLRTLPLSPEATALMNIETVPVARRYVTDNVRMVGRVDYDETRLGYITAWVAGRLDRLYVDYTGVEVKKGDHLVYIYSEELYAVQEELIQALKYAKDRPASTTRLGLGDINLVESAREKLRLLGMTEEQIADIEKRKQPSDHMTIYAPMGGVVIDKLKQQGERVQLGERIYTIADLSLVWVHLDAYESDLPWVRYGQDVTITTDAYPGEEFHGRIAFIQPVLNDKTRTVKVRVNVPNEDGKLKPDMFVHAVVHPKVAAGGKVMDPSLAGKWISPMHPEIVRDEPGTCPICGMPLVRAESLGYVTTETDQEKPPLVVPYPAALVTGTRAIVYVELPSMPTYAEPALQTLSAVVKAGELKRIREAFATYVSMLDRPYDQPGTHYAKRLWDQFADRIREPSLSGERVQAVKDAEHVLNRIETVMIEVRERFAFPDQPTFEGREIVLGPRAGDYYLVRNGLEEGELVVTHGNFKIDAEIQIQAKPSMMTPEGGGGGGGHMHGSHGGEPKPTGGEQHTGHAMNLPAAFLNQLRNLEAAYEQLSEAIRRADLGNIRAAFSRFGQVLGDMDESLLTDHPRMLWKEFSMLLGNDVVEGRDARQLQEADRVYRLLKAHMLRLRDQFGIQPRPEQPAIPIAVSQDFQSQLAAVWEWYLAVEEALAADSFQEAQRLVVELESAVDAIDNKSLAGHTQEVWDRESANLDRLVDRLKKAQDIKSVRIEFSPLSQEMGVLIKTFGLGDSGPIYELHCPMAFQGRGAIWYQNNDEVRNPYFGSTMPECADHVERITHEGPAQPHEHNPRQNPSQR